VAVIKETRQKKGCHNPVYHVDVMKRKNTEIFDIDRHEPKES
jgi:hypothetical protein